MRHKLDFKIWQDLNKQKVQSRFAYLAFKHFFVFILIYLHTFKNLENSYKIREHRQQHWAASRRGSRSLRPRRARPGTTRVPTRVCHATTIPCRLTPICHTRLHCMAPMGDREQMCRDSQTGKKVCRRLGSTVHQAMCLCVHTGTWACSPTEEEKKQGRRK